MFCRRDREVQVILHVYSIGRSPLVFQVNKLLQSMGTGAFHVGVEVHGKEWSFGAGQKAECGGICSAPPAKDPYHLHYVAIAVGQVSLDESEVRDILGRLCPSWLAESYDS